MTAILPRPHRVNKGVHWSTALLCIPWNDTNKDVSAVDKRSPSRQMRLITRSGDPTSNMTPEVARWATHPSISGNMIKQKACKFCVNITKNVF